MGSAGKSSAGGVGLMQHERREHGGLCVLCQMEMLRRATAARVRVELDAFDAEERVLGGEQHRAAFACADVEEDGALDGREWMQLLEPEIEHRAKDAGSDAVVGGEVFRCSAGFHAR